ncbi:hypothetical protein J6590_009369 [Homalodisca vitripennis]|nr:hypothetical protein J6590_009369 [Homalodisca vitripennis]
MDTDSSVAGECTDIGKPAIVTRCEMASLFAGLVDHAPMKTQLFESVVKSATSALALTLIAWLGRCRPTQILKLASAPKRPNARITGYPPVYTVSGSTTRMFPQSQRSYQGRNGSPILSVCKSSLLNETMATVCYHIRCSWTPPSLASLIHSFNGSIRTDKRTRSSVTSCWSDAVETRFWRIPSGQHPDDNHQECGVFTSRCGFVRNIYGTMHHVSNIHVKVLFPYSVLVQKWTRGTVDLCPCILGNKTVHSNIHVKVLFPYSVLVQKWTRGTVDLCPCILGNKTVHSNIPVAVLFPYSVLVQKWTRGTVDLCSFSMCDTTATVQRLSVRSDTGSDIDKSGAADTVTKSSTQ